MLISRNEFALTLPILSETPQRRKVQSPKSKVQSPKSKVQSPRPSALRICFGLRPSDFGRLSAFDLRASAFKLRPDAAAAFAFFCQWAFDASRCGPGKKVFLADEVWRWFSPGSIPRVLAQLAQAGRMENLELMTVTQLPHRVNASITGQATELVCFRTDERLTLDRVEELGAGRTIVQELPLGSYLALNRLSRGRLCGRLF